MTDREKAIVMAYTGCTMLTGDRLEVFYNYAEEKLNFRVMTHEFAYPEVEEALHRASYEDFIKLCDDGETKPEIDPGKFRELMDEMAAHVQKEPTDADETHLAADNLMCEILEQFGYGEGIAAFKEMPKWYS